MTTPERNVLARALALAENASPHLSGSTAARLADALEVLGLENLVSGEYEALELSGREWLASARNQVSPDQVKQWTTRIETLAAAGISVVTVADDGFPENLRTIHNRPPVLFVRGNIAAEDARAVAVVGTRKPSESGRRIASDVAAGLAARQITVVSGLAAGIDTAAHSAAVNARGRTIAVLGTGIERTFPAANAGLARAVANSGACVSQFWPTQSGARWTFPIRNIVTSGLSLGTVVVEAGETSGARLQAQDALRHGRRLFLMEGLVTTQPWAKQMATLPAVTVASGAEQIIEVVERELSWRSGPLELAL